MARYISLPTVTTASGLRYFSMVQAVSSLVMLAGETCASVLKLNTTDLSSAHIIIADLQ